MSGEREAAAVRRTWADQRERAKRRQRLIAELVVKFEMDREALEDTIETATLAYEIARYPENREVDADDLDQVADHLEKAAAFLWARWENDLNRFRLDRALGADHFDAFNHDRSAAVAEQLHTIAGAARRSHRGKTGGQPREPGLFEAAIVFADFWESLNRRFTVGSWPGGLPKGDGGRFIWEAMVLIAPHNLRGLQDIIKEIAKDRKLTDTRFPRWRSTGKH